MYGQGQGPQQYPQGQPQQPYGAPPPQPGYGAPQQPPAYGAPQPPAYGAPQPPAYGTPQDQPGYGAPQQPPAYGAPQPPAGQPGYGYPQQAPPPQQQWGGVPPQPGQPGQPGYGGFPPPAAPSKGKGGIIALVVVLVLAVGGGVGWWALSGTKGADTAGKYKLSAPESVAGYTMKNSSEKGSLTGLDAIGSFEGSLSATYQKTATDVASFSGSWGSIPDPGKALDTATQKVNEGDGEADAEKPVWKQELTEVDAGDPKDPGAKLRCGVSALDTGTSKGSMDVPICLFASHSTIGVVAFVSMDPSGKTISVADAQARARQIRDAATVAK
ncbi:hypothetical protein ACIQF6_13830 [Kitasatospora sp. NPDC092948]|uniref:hypothetical protein n=1 Tax=Kitasatospora sp. NPDC092948 TaxID=3364088 RepID=UPI00380323E0